MDVLNRFPSFWRYAVLPIMLFWGLSPASAQLLQGRIVNSAGQPVPYASIYIKELKQGTTSNTEGNFSINLPGGTYTLIFRCMGYATLEKKVTPETNKRLLIKMQVKPFQLEAVVVGNSKEDQAYAIVRKAISMAPFYNNQLKSFRARVYIKGSLKITKLTWLVKRSLRNEKDAPHEGSYYIQESINEISYTAPDKYKQVVKKFRSNFPGDKGDAGNIMQFVGMSFYSPMLGDIILPLAPYALKHYRYRYAGYSFLEGRVINKIEVIPRRESKQLVRGYIFIADDYWNLHGVDLTLNSRMGTLRIRQTFGEVEDQVWLPVSHYFTLMGSFLGNKGVVSYTSSVRYLDISLNKNLAAVQQNIRKSKPPKRSGTSPAFAKSRKRQSRAFRDSVAMAKLLAKQSLTNREMYKLSRLMARKAKRSRTAGKSLEVKEPVNVTIDSSALRRDTSDWERIRPIALTSEEIKVSTEIDRKINLKSDTLSTSDTLESAPKSEGLFAVLTGKSWRNDSLHSSFRYYGLIGPGRFEFNTVDGFKLSTGFSYRRKFESIDFSVSTEALYAFSRKAPMSKASITFGYFPARRGQLSLKAGWLSDDFNQSSGVDEFSNTIASLWFGRNYLKLFENRFVTLSNTIDIANGTEVSLSVGFADKRQLHNTTDFIIIGSNRHLYSSNIPDNPDVPPAVFADNTAFRVGLGLKFTPRYHYRWRNNRKEMLYSYYPTFSVNYSMGVPGVMGPASDFTHWELAVNQKVRIVPANVLKYRLVYGDFGRKDQMHFSDYKHFNAMSIPVVLGTFDAGYRTIDYYSRATNGRYFQIFTDYRAKHLLLKYLPLLNKTYWEENIHFSALVVPGNKPYYELGYSIDRIAVFGGMGFFVGFEGKQPVNFGFKISILKLGNGIVL